MRNIDRLQPLLLVAGLKIVVAITILVWVLARSEGEPGVALQLAQIAALAAAGMLLVVGGRHDLRAVHLGFVCLLLAAAFTPHDTLEVHASLQHPWSALLFAFANLRIEVFLAPLVCLFVRNFPAVPLSFRVRRGIDRLIRLSWFVALALLCGHLFWLWSTLAPTAERMDGWQDPIYLPSILAIATFAAAALAFLGWKAYRFAGDEARRGRLVIVALAGATIVSLAALVRLAPDDTVYELSATTRLVTLLAVNAVLMAIPFTIAYAVLVERILDVRGIARKAVQHTLTRSTARLLIAAPFAFLALYLYQHRDASLVELFSPRHLMLLAVALAGFAGLRYRRQMLDAIDRHFFPEQYNARRILDQLPDQIRGARDLEQLTNLIGHGLSLAWQLDRATLLVRSRDGELLLDLRNELPPIAADAQLVAVLAGKHQPVEVDMASEGSPMRRLPENERYWLVDGRVRLLAPAYATDGSLNALIALGGKRRELPFVAEDLRLMSGISSSTGLIVEILELKDRESSRRITNPFASADELEEGILSSSQKAAECYSCGRVYPAETPRCGKCGLELGESMVPYALRRMFRFEERIGIGGMAVVYRATDLKLGRSVAIKTLPRVSPEAAVRLQQEARTAATVSHPGLAAIYGIETWEGTPMLILEFLEGGTLSARLAEGPLPAAEVVETGQIVAQALEVIHEFGILHRDIKPSNIGYTKHGDAKLLDFGIARIYQDLRRDTEDPSEILTVDGRLMQQVDNITGTLCYFSPEALDDAPPDPTFDLWSLTVVMYEALTASNLFYRPRLKDMLKAIREADMPDPSTLVPDCPPALVEFFRSELNPDLSQRSKNGREFYQRLERIRRGLAPQPTPAKSTAEPNPAAQPLADVASS